MANIDFFGTWNNVPYVDLPAVGGGSARLYDMSPTYAWMGRMPELVSTWVTETPLSETGYASWTPSTTATNVQAATTHNTFTADLTNNEYCVEYLWEVDYVYPSGTTAKAMALKSYGYQAYFIFKRASTLTSITDGTSPYNIVPYMYPSSNYIKYYNSSGTLSNANAPSYGIWMYYSGSEPTLSSTASDTPTVTLRNPIIRARCSTTYLSTANATALDQAKTLFKVRCNVYRINVGTNPVKATYEAARNVYNNPLFELPPTGYREVNGFKMNNNCYFKINDFYLEGSDTVQFSFSVTSACNVLGCYTAADAQDNYSLYATFTSGGAYLRYNGGTYNSYVTSGTRYNMVITPTGATGLATSSSWTAKTFTAPTELLIGTTSVNATSSKLVGTLYGRIIVKNRLKLIPCERLSDNVFGYYDGYSGKFYEPTGTPPTEYV